MAFKRNWPSGQLADCVMGVDTGGIDPVLDFREVLKKLLPEILLLKLRKIAGAFTHDGFVNLLCPKKVDETARIFKVKWSPADLGNLKRIYNNLCYERGPVKRRSRKNLCPE